MSQISLVLYSMTSIDSHCPWTCVLLLGLWTYLFDSRWVTGTGSFLFMFWGGIFFFNLYEKISSRKMWSEPRSKQSHFDLVGWWMILCLCMSCKNQELVWGGSMAMPSPFFMLAWCNYLLVKCIVLFIYMKIPGREPHTAFCQSKYNNGFQCQIFLDLNFNSDCLALWPWANYLISLNLGVLICESDNSACLIGLLRKVKCKSLRIVSNTYITYNYMWL